MACLADLLNAMGAKIEGAGSHTITIDGGEGGTGAGPLVFSDHVALPFKIGFSRVQKIFWQAGLHERVVFVGSGKLGFPEAALFASEGAQVFLTDVLEAEGEATAAAVGGRFRRHDVTSEGDWDDVVRWVLDTAGRLAIDEQMMNEIEALKKALNPNEILFVVDAMTGQDAVNTARTFNERLNFDGVVLTKMDGDARGGAALSIYGVTKKPIKFIGVGEKPDALEPFHPDRIASRILGMGDIVSLVERAAETIEKEDAEKLAAKVRKGQFDMDDLLSQLRQLRKMGGMQGLLGMLPGALQAKAAMSKAKIDEKQLKRQEAVILSMTPKERRNPDLIHASRKKRIAAGSGVAVQDVNKLLKQHADMLKMMKRVNKLGEKGFMRSLGGMTPPPGFPR